MSPRDALTTALPRFLRRCDAKSTREAYRRELLRFLAWLPAAPTDETLFDYRDHLRAKNLGPTTIRWRTTVARSFLHFAKRRGYLDLDLVADFEPPKGKMGFAPRVLTQAELDRLIATPDRRTARGRRDAAVLVCLGVGGLRAGEVCRLNTEDIEVHPHKVVLTVSGKGRKQRRVELHGRWVRVFRAYMRSALSSSGRAAPAFYCGPRMAHRITRPAVDYLVRQAAGKTDVYNLHPHALRHTAAILALEAGVPTTKVRDQLGHSSIATTQLYLRGAT